MSIAFDTLRYARDAEAVGIKKEHAEFQARELSRLMADQLITKSELKTLEVNIVKWIVGISLAQMGFILAILGFISRH